MRTLNFVIYFINIVTDGLFGWNFTFGSKCDRLEAQENYSKSAQIVDILFRGDFSLVNVRRLRNFFFRHNRYVHPNYVLEHDNVTFYGFSQHHAYFCISNVDVEETKKFPFLFMSQFTESQQLIIMPIKHFHRLASEVGIDTSTKVVNIHMTVRYAKQCYLLTCFETYWVFQGTYTYTLRHPVYIH